MRATAVWRGVRRSAAVMLFACVVSMAGAADAQDHGKARAVLEQSVQACLQPYIDLVIDVSGYFQ